MSDFLNKVKYFIGIDDLDDEEEEEFDENEDSELPLLQESWMI